MLRQREAFKAATKMTGTHYVRIENGGNKMFTLPIIDKEITVKSLKEAFTRVLMSHFYVNVKHAGWNNFQLVLGLTLLYSNESRKVRARPLCTRYVYAHDNGTPLWETLMKEENCPKNIQAIMEYMLDCEKRRLSPATTTLQNVSSEEEDEEEIQEIPPPATSVAATKTTTAATAEPQILNWTRPTWAIGG